MTTDAISGAVLRKLGDEYRDALAVARAVGEQIDQIIQAEQAAGRPAAELGAQSGLTTPQLEYILVSADVQRRLLGPVSPCRPALG